TSSSTAPSQSSSARSHTASSSATCRQRYSQPLSGSPSRSRKPTSHATTTQAPSSHAPNACAGAQRMPHPPQLSSSLARSIPSSIVPSQSSSAPLHSSVASGAHPSPGGPASRPASGGAASPGTTPPASRPPSTAASSSRQSRQNASTEQPARS